MAIAFRSASAVTTAASASGITLVAPSGVAATDIVIAVIHNDAGAAAAPSGWTIVGTLAHGVTTRAYWALGNVATYAFSGLSGSWIGATFAYTGVDNTTPMDATAVSQNADAAAMVAPSITTVTDGALLVGSYGWYNNATQPIPTFSSEFGAHRLSGGLVSGATTVALDVCDASQATAGASGTKSVTASGTPTFGTAMLIALRPVVLLSGPSFDSTAFTQSTFETSSGTLYSQTVAGTLASSGSLTKLTLRSLTATLTSSGGLAKQIARALTATHTSSGAIVKRAQKVFVGALTSSGALTSFKVALVSIAGTLTSAGALVKMTQKSLSAAMSSAGTLVKQTLKTFAGTLTSTGALLKQTNKLLTGTLTSSATLASVKAAFKTLAGTLTSSGTLARLPNKALSGTLTSAGAIVKRTAKGIAGVLAPVGTLAKRISHSLSGALSFIGAFVGSGGMPPTIGPPLSGRQDAASLTGRQDAPALTGKSNQDPINGSPS